MSLHTVTSATTADVPLDADRLHRAKVAYSVRRVDLDRPLSLVDGRAPRHGDLVLAEVVTVGQHAKLELTTSRRASLYRGDEIVVAFGARYAPDQFEAEVPADLGECDLVAAGGCAAGVRSRHGAMKPATRIRPIGLIATGGRVLNVADGALPAAPARIGGHVPTILVAGTSMNAGKTTTVASLVHGLTAAGLRVGAGKFTGTGAGGDRYAFADAGAVEVLDFTDLGHVSTYRVPVPRIAQVAGEMHDHLTSRGVDAVVLEIADGVLFGETRALLAHPTLRGRVDGTVFAAGDAAGALLGVGRIRAAGHHVLAVSGLVTASPLALREAQAELDVPVYGTRDLCDPVLAADLLTRLVPATTAARPADVPTGITAPRRPVAVAGA